jgi:hypothetical protein
MNTKTTPSTVSLEDYDVSATPTSDFHSEFTSILKRATKSIHRSYIDFAVYGQGTTLRERVYCYELYHQMRKIWNSPDFWLNGEVDKAAHLELKKKGLRAYKPDILVHKPGGGNSYNHTVIEVKTKNVECEAIIKDLRSLCDFVVKAHYQRAIFLVYGSHADSHTRPELLEALDKFRHSEHTDSPSCLIEVWFHSRNGEEAAPRHLIRLSADALPALKKRKTKQAPQ